MTSIQQLLTIGGIVILTYLMLNYNQSENHRVAATQYNDIILSGTEVGQSLMEEIISKPFDENVLEERAEDENDLTHANSLGPDSSEVSSLYFDDVDDYDDLVINDSTKLTGNYEAKVLVNYFDYNNGNIVSSRSFAKLIQVFVTNENLEDTVKLYHIKGY